MRHPRYFGDRLELVVGECGCDAMWLVSIESSVRGDVEGGHAIDQHTRDGIAVDMGVGVRWRDARIVDPQSDQGCSDISRKRGSERGGRTVAAAVCNPRGRS